MKKHWFIVILIAVFQSVAAQQTVKVTVTDYDSGDPLPGVKVKSDSGGYCVTDIDGQCSLQAQKTIQVTAEGYKTATAKVKPEIKIRLRKKAIELNEVVIKTDPLRDPVHSVVVSDMEKKYSQPRNTAELFKDIPGVSLQKRSAMSTEPSIRSFKYEEMNLKYDGGFKMVNACPNRMDPAPAHVIPEEVEKIELIKGPYNVRFGQTFGAIVNMVTRKPSPGNYGWAGLVQAGYEANGQNKIALAQLRYAEKKFDSELNFSYRDFGDYTDGNGITVPAGFQSTEYSVKFGYNPADNHRFLIDWRQNFTRNVKHPGLMMDSPKDDSYLIGLDYRMDKLPGKFKAYQFKAYYSYVDHLMTNGYLMDNPRPNYPVFDARTPVWSRTLGGKVETEYQPDAGKLIYLGADVDAIARDGVKTVYITANPNTGVPYSEPIVKTMKVWQNAQINDFGFYAQGSWKKDHRQVFGAGLRLDYVWSIAKDPAQGMIDIYGDFGARTDITLSGNLSYKLRGDGYKFQVALGRGTRTPNMQERYIYRFVIMRDSREYIGNPFLKPEVNNQAEVSYIRNLDKWSLGTDVYASYFQNYITAFINSALTSSTGSCGQPPRAPKQFTNADAYQYGADFYVAYRPDAYWTFKADYSYIKAYNLRFDEPLAQVNPPSAHFKIKYQKEKYWFDLRTEWAAAKNDVSATFGEKPTPSYATVDIMLGYKPFQNLTLGLSVTNLTDTAYYYHTTFVYRNTSDELNGRPIYEPGRNIGFMLTYKF
jgi:iron complex outermembrane receptor protein